MTERFASFMMTGLGQNRKSSMRAYVFRFAPESGHRALQSACLFRAKLGNGSRRKIALHCEPTRSEAVMSRHIVLVPMS
jgi:hypothetical protein